MVHFGIHKYLLFDIIVGHKVLSATHILQISAKIGLVKGDEGDLVNSAGLEPVGFCHRKTKVKILTPGL